MPSAFTLGNLFFGFWAIVSAFNGNFRWAGWFIVFAGILDMLDGRVARLSGTGTRFGAELDSLVDVISFGVAPALLMYFLDFSNAGRFAWILCYIYVVAVALRLARFNVLSAGKPPSAWFTGLPSPVRGYDPGSVLPFQPDQLVPGSLAYYLDLQHEGLVVLMLLLAVLMVSNVKYPKFPPIGLRSRKGIFGLLGASGHPPRRTLCAGVLPLPLRFVLRRLRYRACDRPGIDGAARAGTGHRRTFGRRPRRHVAPASLP